MRILTINTGSSSLKAGLYQVEANLPETAVDSTTAKYLADVPAFAGALRGILAPWSRPDAVGHRLVIGGAAWIEPRHLDDAAIAEIRALVPWAPDHLPQALAAIECTRTAFPDLPQIACSDSAFHRTLPDVARTFALPRGLRDQGVVRYGFHGLSCEYVLSALQAEDPVTAAGRIVIAHLGNGASLTAVRGGRSLDTTMGFTPLGGLPMSTRSGDLDPGVLVYLLRQRQLTPEALNHLLNRESGLLGLSGTTGDMRTLLRQSATDPNAAAAVELFVYQARKFLGAMAAVLGGLDVLVFTGGIGESSAEIRDRISQGMEWLGMKVQVIPTDEDRMIARHTARAARGSA